MDLSELFEEKKRAPGVVADCVRFLRDYGLQHEGLFRNASDQHLYTEVKQRMRMDSRRRRSKTLLVIGKTDSNIPTDVAIADSEQLVVENIDDVAAVLKMFLLDLNEPVVTFQAFKEIMGATAALEKNEITSYKWSSLVNHAIASMPTEHKTTFFFLLDFLGEVSSYSSTNKMTNFNLAVVFGPTLMRSPVNEEQALSALDMIIEAKTIQKSLVHILEERFPSANKSPNNAQVSATSSMLGGFVMVSITHIIVFALAVFYLLHTRRVEKFYSEPTLAEQLSLGRHISPLYLGCIRSFFGSIVWSSCLHILLDSEGLQVSIPTRAGDLKLITLKYLQRFSMFTVWCWTIQGVYFAMSSYASFATAFGWPIPSLFLYYAPVVYEIAFATAYLVTIVVTFVLIPVHRKKGIPTNNFFKPLPLLFHNANVLFMMFEICFNNIPFDFEHFPYIVFYGQIYVMFSWQLFRKIGVFYYFFLDYEGKFAVVWQLGLLFALSLFFYAGSIISSTMQNGNGGIGTMACIFLVTLATLKLRP